MGVRNLPGFPQARRRVAAQRSGALPAAVPPSRPAPDLSHSRTPHLPHPAQKRVLLRRSRRSVAGSTPLHDIPARFRPHHPSTPAYPVPHAHGAGQGDCLAICERRGGPLPQPETRNQVAQGGGVGGLVAGDAAGPQVQPKRSKDQRSRKKFCPPGSEVSTISAPVRPLPRHVGLALFVFTWGSGLPFRQAQGPEPAERESPRYFHSQNSTCAGIAGSTARLPCR